jgi:hypothetical protein
MRRVEADQPALNEGGREPWEVEWSGGTWNDESINLAYEACEGMLATHYSLADASDRKTLAVFTVGSALLSVAPAIGWGDEVSGWAYGLWAAAFVSWIATCLTCYFAYKPNMFRIHPNPGKLLSSEWLELKPDEFRVYQLRDMGRSYRHNLACLVDKGEWLDIATLAAFAEVLFLVLATIVR